MQVLRGGELMFQSCYETIVIRVAGQTSRKEECGDKSGIFELMESVKLHWKQVAEVYWRWLLDRKRLGN